MRWNGGKTNVRSFGLNAPLYLHRPAQSNQQRILWLMNNCDIFKSYEFILTILQKELSLAYFYNQIIWFLQEILLLFT